MLRSIQMAKESGRSNKAEHGNGKKRAKPHERNAPSASAKSVSKSTDSKKWERLEALDIRYSKGLLKTGGCKKGDGDKWWLSASNGPTDWNGVEGTLEAVFWRDGSSSVKGMIQTFCGHSSNPSESVPASSNDCAWDLAQRR